MRNELLLQLCPGAGRLVVYAERRSRPRGRLHKSPSAPHTPALRLSAYQDKQHRTRLYRLHSQVPDDFRCLHWDAGEQGSSTKLWGRLPPPKGMERCPAAQVQGAWGGAVVALWHSRHGGATLM